MIVITRAVQTCFACPSQWDAWDADGNYWYLRFRHGRGTAERQPGPFATGTWDFKEPELSFVHGELDGCIELAEFCARAGLSLELA